MTGISPKISSFYTVPSQGILGLKVNVKNFRWPFGSRLPNANFANYNTCAIKICLQVDQDKTFKDVERKCEKQGWGKYHFLSGKYGGKLVFYRRPFLFGSKIYLEASNLTDQEPLIRVNKNYYRFIHFRFMNLHSVSYILMDLAALLLLRQKLAPVYCSVFRKGDQTVIVFAPSNTGKTLTTMMACLNNGADFISEDIAITDGQKVYGVPWTSTFRYYSDIDVRWISRTVNNVTKKLPFLELLPIIRNKDITHYLPEDRICHKSIATHLVILERGENRVQSEPRETIFRKILNMNRAEFNYQRSLVNNAYEFFNPELDIPEAYETECTILRQLVENVKDCLVVRSNDPTKYTDLVMQAIT